ncbi:IS1182 family transposase [Ktedonosporobacter rubrisoli]|uniref:IS1182 family transposase n=1 Tax=Ktedonosporobacter rubrisoli TaxID=2509675 RepID=A0A4P6JJN6_KTERU|nr:IS1182 family transposase [Ktedonosporobacter rubrisoli]QBD75152.1 IS1182 family transposase [Ktedonosporobacter rubrisoli]
MGPSTWHPPVELSSLERTIITLIKRAKLFVFLRHHRHELFDDAFQGELATLYAPSLRGQPPIPPAQLALATIVQADTGVSDDEVIEATLMDRRWQLVLDCLDTEQAPFSKGTLVAFRKRLIEAQMDRRLIERTIELASQSQGFGARALRAALDSSPLWGAGRVEDTYNLVGHALKKVMRVVADQQERDLVEVAKEAGAELVCESSLKAALDRDWDQQIEKDEALTLVLNVLQAVETWVQTLQQEDAQMAQPSLSVAQQIQAQDVEVDEKGKASLIKGVAKDRRISVEDSEMRHGRKSRSVRVDGYKRHVLHDLDTCLIRAVGITPANAPEASVTEVISEDLAQQAASLKELHIDRAYLSSHLVRERGDELEVFCKAWPVRNGKRFHKQAFMLNWERQTIQCPAKQEMPFVPGGVVHFPKETCAECPLKAQCTTSSKGRSVSIHPDEALLIELRELQQTSQGRAKLRERVAVEHTLAHIGQWQGRRARYRGLRKNLLDLRRCAVVHNLHVLARSQLFQADLQDAA